MNRPVRDPYAGWCERRTVGLWLTAVYSISPHIILIQQWEEDPDDKTGWSTWGWEYENGNLFDEVGYELEEVLEEDKYGHITKARFKYVG